MPKQSTATRTEKTTEKKFLKCILTEEEKKQVASEMAQAICQKDSLENDSAIKDWGEERGLCSHCRNEMESIKAQIKAKVKEYEATIIGNAEKIRSGYEMREIECEMEIDRSQNMVWTTRLDTGEIIKERNLTFAEMIIYKNYCDEEVEIPHTIDDFIKEYEVICKKYNLMIISDGEPIIVDKYRKDLWGIRKSVANDISDRLARMQDRKDKQNRLSGPSRF